MINLNHPVWRRTRDTYAVLLPKPEKIVVTVFPGDVSVFRKERGRHEWYLPVAVAFRSTVQRQVRLATKEIKGGHHV